MTAPRCLRCGDPFEPGRVGQEHCNRCARERAALIAADTERRERRVFRPADLTPFSGRPAA